jgi:putative spermidine/putrescine transport system ATP-binding protein
MECLALVRLVEYAQRMPHQLSGGQQQRVAIARALAIRPTVLLLDEPLSNLDAKLRKEMQTELRNLQRNVGITTVLVTHDQEEALSLSDRIGILERGRLQQIGTPVEVYRRPSNLFVAEFIGQVNLANTKKAPDTDGVPEGYLAFIAADWLLDQQQQVKVAVPESPELKGQSEVLMMLRPERIRVSMVEEGPGGFNQVAAIIKSVNYVGNSLRIRVALAGRGELLIQAPDPVFTAPPEEGQALYLNWEPEDLVPLLGEERPYDS